MSEYNLQICCHAITSTIIKLKQNQELTQEEKEEIIQFYYDVCRIAKL
jgi:hypothetical protein